MLKTAFTKVFGNRHHRAAKRMGPTLAEIHQHEQRLGALSEDELKGQTGKLRGILAERTAAIRPRLDEVRTQKHECADPAERVKLEDEFHKLDQEYKKILEATLDEILPEAFATVREVCRRLLGTTVMVTGHELAWDMVPYDVQLIGGIALHQGKIAEMATGEGKTLVATLPLYLNALTGRGAHLVTVNNYLARRDSQWMGHVFRYLGLTVGVHRRHRAVDARPAGRVPGRHHLRHQQRIRLRLPPRQHGVLAGAAGPAGARLRHRRRSGLDPDRRGPDPADHLGAGGERGRHQVRRLQRQGRRPGPAADPGGEPADRRGASRSSPTTRRETEAGYKLYQAQLGMPKNKKLLKLLNETGVKQLVQQAELRLPGRPEASDQAAGIPGHRGRRSTSSSTRRAIRCT